ncbi:voltage-gated potassium channel [Methylomarinovum caldicuralii]|uniref:Voltage-gated potassium channel n=1 Tax=Methylomarinovum caldicuralii TaxID=438856 RepID=A0AAU9BYD4_9GAMM|nr:potassium channel family protein [Methylomarinovum caldicuralii]BCX81077.1 voltage-gated potassium channel [Methylomarinovum caldicuralii]
MNDERWKRGLGVAGVSPYETVRAKRLGRWFEWPMLALAVLIPFRWYFEFKGRLDPRLAYGFDWIIWGLFVLEAVLISLNVRDPKRYLRENWLNLFIIIVIFPPLWKISALPASLRLLRLVVLVDLLLRLLKVIFQVLRRNTLGATLIAASVIIVVSGVVMSAIDPAFETPFDGIWWAWVTVSTVGYGDYVPVSTWGRILAIFIILLGIGLFALLTAQISAALIGRVGENLGEVEREVQRLEIDEAAIHLHIEQLERRLERIERLLEAQVEAGGKKRPQALDEKKTNP